MKTEAPGSTRKRSGTTVALFSGMETERRNARDREYYFGIKCVVDSCRRLRYGDNKYCKQHAYGLRRKLRESVLRDCGLVKVKGSLGGTYWE